MWYEIVPCFSIILAAMAIPAAGNYFVNKLILGNPAKREICNEFDVYFYLRDFRITGDTYKQQGLEGIPDK